ncbi:ornithine cyclodeaminase [Massilia sp. Root351]|uniref:ornithine cyclodeaminase family protein n=1 Tax=Massilia sp. Root351 TaxID=1736522 RepID=UPI00070C723B|nr:ornithine cyclodeaminase family protein [Massilia sp. Root351]KQV79862.1 ornithine cyclodeaminase [Massilia sp. Root351]
MPNNARLLLIDSVQGETLMNFRDVLDATREAFVLHQQEEGRVFPLVRERLPEGIWGIKSGQVVAQNLLGFKSAGFWPGNREKGGEPHQATIVLVDPATGRPQCIIDGNGVTTMRTGAAGGLGLLQLARADSNRVCVFGTGVQARVQLRYALELIPSLHQVDYVSSSGEADLAFERQFSERCTVTPAADRNASVALADIVITATTGRGPLFNLDAVRPGTHFNCVGADTLGKRELPEGLLRQARLFVDDHIQARQIGEMQWAPELPCHQLGELLSGQLQAHRKPEDITIFDMTGIALQDLTVARLIYERALARGVGTSVAWPW